MFVNRELQNCRHVTETDAGRINHYVELAELVESRPLLNQDEDNEPQLRRPKVRCDTEDIAKWVIFTLIIEFCQFWWLFFQVSQQIIFAKGMYEEKIRTLALLSDLED